MMTREELKERQSIVGIINYEDIYSITKDGTVYRTRTKHKDIFRKIQTKMKPNGYLYCTLSRGGLHKNFYIHRLVAQAFIPNPENKPHIDHINGDRKDNRVENLRWVTHKENNNNPITNKRMREVQKKKYNTPEGRKEMKRRSLLAFTDEAKAKKRETIKRPEIMAKWTKNHGRPVIQYTMDGEYIAEYDCIRAAHEATGACHIGDVCRGVRNWAGGYKWKFKQI